MNDDAPRSCSAGVDAVAGSTNVRRWRNTERGMEYYWFGLKPNERVKRYATTKAAFVAD